MADHETHSGSKQQGCLSRLGSSLFFLVFAAVGLTISGFMVAALVGELRPYLWTEVDCTIEESRVETAVEARENPHQLVVAYRYRLDGRDYEGDQLWIGYSGSDQASDAERLLDRYPAGARVTGWADPEAPARSVLERRIPWWGLALALPLLFGLIGLGGLLHLWAPGLLPTLSPAAPRPKSAKSGPGCGVLVFGLFMAGGGVATWFFLAQPLLLTLQARSWEPTECTVIQSRVLTHQGDDGDTYSVDILYRYRVGEREYRSNRYDFFRGSTSGYDSKREIVRRYPAGTVAECRVHPEDPTRAVLSTQLRTEFLFGLIPAAFFLIGLAGWVWMAREGRRKESFPSPTQAQRIGPWVLSPEAALQPTVLEPHSTRTGKLVGALVFALIWNGITAAGLYAVFGDTEPGEFPWLMALFFTPFVLVGLAAAASVPYLLLGLFNPRFRLELGGSAVPVGGELPLQWQASGPVGLVRKLSLTLTGEEKAVVRAGGDSKQRSEEFAAETLFTTRQRPEMRRGHTVVRVPAGAMHSLESGRFQVLWKLAVRAEIPWWPDVHDEYELTVSPTAPEPPRRDPSPTGMPEPPRFGQGGIEPPGSITIHLDGGRHSYAPGDTVKGDVTWRLDESVESVELRLFWFAGAGSLQEPTVVELLELPGGGTGRYPFSMQLPEGPWSFEGELFQVTWALEAVPKPASSEPGYVELTVAPDGNLRTLDR